METDHEQFAWLDDDHTKHTYRENLMRFRSYPFKSKVMAEYYRRMSQPRTKVIFDDNVANMLHAQGYSVEESPRSIYDPEKLYEALAMYAPGRVGSPEVDEHLLAGLSLAYACFAKPKDEPYLTMLDFTPETVQMVTSNLKGSAGATNFGRSKAESFTQAYERGLETLKGKKAPEPCVAFARTQFKGKTRLVWGFPYSQTVIEGMVAYPFLQMLKRRHTPMAFAITTMALGSKLRVAAYKNNYAYSIDMSTFDASVSKYMICRAFDIIKTWFSAEQCCVTTGIPSDAVLRDVKRYFYSSPIVMPDGNIYCGRNHGVPSGSYFTQIVDSIVNVIIAGTISSRFRLGIDKKEIFVLGDDLLIWSKRNINLTTIASYASEKFGTKFNPDKSKKVKSLEPVEYLGRIWTKGIPDIDREEVVKRMIYPERFRRYSKDHQKRLHEVENLILSYAAVYWCGWEIANDVLGSPLWNVAPGAIEYKVYRGARDEPLCDADHLSGLERFMRKYIRESSASMPHVATSFWM